jgi:hypothetical protein
MAEQVIAQQAAQAPLMEELRMLRQALEGRAGTPTPAPAETPREEEPRAQMKPMALRRNASVEERIQRFTQEDPIIQAIIWQESRGNPKAKSRAGAAGLMQLMPGTAKELGVSDPFDPEQSLDGGTRYYNQQARQFDDPELALAAYNWGPGNVNKALRRLRAKGREETWDNIVKYMSVPSETLNYVSDVIRRSKQIENNPTAWWESKLRA